MISEQKTMEIEMLIRMWKSRRFSASDISKLSRRAVGKFYSRNQIISLMHTRGIVGGKMTGSAKKEPGRLIPGSLGVIERTISDRKRITLIEIPSIAEVPGMQAYSYISRDQMSYKRTKGRRSAV